MNRILVFLDGKKTIIGIIAGGVLVILYELSAVSPTVAAFLATGIGVWTLIALRAAIGKAPQALVGELARRLLDGLANPPDLDRNGPEGGPLDS